MTAYMFYNPNSLSSPHAHSLSLSLSAGLHRRAGVQGVVSRGGRLGGAAGQVEPPGGEKCRPTGGRHSEGQKSGRCLRACEL